MTVAEKILNFIAACIKPANTGSSNNSFSLSKGLDKAYEEETITHGAISGEKTMAYKIMMGEYSNPFDNE